MNDDDDDVVLLKFFFLIILLQMYDHAAIISMFFVSLCFSVNLLQPGVAYLYLLKTSENLKVF